MSGRVLWDVDTQVDFVLPHGKLYVPDAEKTLTAMQRLVEAAREARLVHVASVDDHELTDPEIVSADEADFTNTYPPHCMRGTPGAEKVAETKQEDPLPLSHVPFPPGLVPDLVAGRREILLLKKNFDVFTNPNTDPLLEALDPDEVILFGVATDVCDDAAILGLLRRGRQVRFVEDASRGLDEARVESCTAVWRQSGVAFSSADEVVGSL
jgi:nicotinamidase/pyrazinamidase